MTAYLIFLQDETKRIKKRNPDISSCQIRTLAAAKCAIIKDTLEAIYRVQDEKEKKNLKQGRKIVLYLKSSNYPAPQSS